MNPFFVSFVALCIAQGAVANYQSAGSNYAGHNQRKMQYGAQSAGYQQAAAPAYQQQQQQSGYEMSNSYAQPSYGQHAAPSSAAVSSYDERTPAASSGYAKAAPSYGRQQASYGQQQSGYGQQQQSYGKAAKYEEPSYPPQPFAWGYDINDGYGGAQYHKESGDEYGKRTGSYGYTDAYGVYRQVDYVADEHGFRATIKTNEPGTANESPADVELHAYEPPSNYYAGNTNNYGSQQSYGKQSSSYGAAQQSYSAPSSGYQQQQQQSYSRPASYGQQQQQRSSYKAQQNAAYGRQMGAYNSEPAAQYSSSAIVPVYQKPAAAAAAAPLAAKKY